MSHWATYSRELWKPIEEMLTRHFPPVKFGEAATAYDPMAGVGTLAQIVAPLGLRFAGCEIEPEYAYQSSWVMPRDCRTYHGRHILIVTSPPYGNRGSDQYLGTPAEIEERAKTGKKPRRYGYAIDLGRRLLEENAGKYQWGPKYRELMASIYEHVVTANLQPGGYFLLNITSHYRGGEYQPVAEWHQNILLNGLGLREVAHEWVETKGQRDGQNRDDRVGQELIVLYRKNS